MKINKDSLKDLDKSGVYKITNLLNGKVYVGSTKRFLSRWYTHFSKLRTNNHRSYIHLQNSVNKYGIENFEFEILEVCSSDVYLEREAFWIKELDSCNREKGYNTNPSPTKSPFADKNIRAKAAKTWVEKYKSGLIHTGTEFKIGSRPWNTGKRYESTDHLKVPKRKKGDRSRFTEVVKEKQNPIEVFNSKGESLGKYRYYQELQKDESLIQHMLLRKNNNSELRASNIQKACKTGKSYKGLIFKTISPQ